MQGKTNDKRALKLRGALITLILSTFVAVGCGSSDSPDTKTDATAGKGEKELVIYSGRERELVEALYERFEKESGIKVQVRYADSAALAAQMQEEGENSPADVFFAQDAGAIGAVRDLLAEMPAEMLENIPSQYRDSEGRWTGVTGRIRTLVYNTDELKPADLPKSVLDVTKPEWRGRVGVAPTNASFIAFVTAMRQSVGEEQTSTFLKALKDNDAKIYEKNGPIVDAVGRGEVPVGLVNHYYLYERLEQNDKLPIANHFFEVGDIGNFVNTSAIGMLESSDHPEEARELIEFLLSEGQEFIVNDAPEREYPLSTATDITSNERYKELPALDSIEGPEVELADLGAELEASVEMIREAGLTS